MLENSNKIISGDHSSNFVTSKQINFWEELDAFVVISTNDSNLLELFSKSLFDSLIAKIQWNDTYVELSEVLDSVNSSLQNYTENGYNMRGMSAIVGIQEKWVLFFSKLWKASAFLIKQNSEVIEITDVKESPINFVYISNGDIKSWEIVLLSTTRILNYLTNTEILESASLDTIEEQNKNIEEIILDEKISKKIAISSYRYMVDVEEDESKMSNRMKKMAASTAENFWDTLMAKRIRAIWLKFADTFKISRIPKNVFLFLWIFIAFVGLYMLSSSVFKTTDKIIVQDYKINLTEARQFVTHASENINNPDVFSSDLEAAGAIIDEIEDKELFLSDINKLYADINALRKEFNQVDTYDFKDDNIVLASTLSAVKMVQLAWNTYVVEWNTITWPVRSWVEAKSSEFQFSDEWDSFIDALEFGGKIILLTEKNRIVSYNSAWTFAYVTVNGQETWEKAEKIWTFASNIYTLDTSLPQISKHRASSNNFWAQETYFTNEDVESLSEVLTMAIDWWFYLLKKDWTLIKFFSNPYRIEWIVLNKLPNNYEYDGTSKVFLYTRDNLSYVYLLMNDKIWIFQPNTKNFQDTKSFVYIGQIEWGNKTIDSFYVKDDTPQNGSILVASSDWVYDLTFQVSEEKLIIQ